MCLFARGAHEMAQIPMLMADLMATATEVMATLPMIPMILMAELTFHQAILIHLPILMVIHLPIHLPIHLSIHHLAIQPIHQDIRLPIQPIHLHMTHMTAHKTEGNQGIGRRVILNLPWIKS